MIYFRFNSKNCSVFIFNNTFEANRGDFGGCMQYDYLNGFVKTEQNIFFKNKAYAASGNKVGCGAVISVTGSSNSSALSLKDKFIGNIGEIKGIYLMYFINI